MSSIQVNSIKRVDGTESFTVDSDGSVTFAAGIDVTGDLTVDTNTFYVDTANNRVGIGTTSPDEALHISKTANSSIRLGTQGQDYAYRLRANVSSSVNGGFLIEDAVSGADLYEVRSGSSGYHAFSINDSEKVRIDSSGNVGIGTSSPGVSLDILSKTDAIGIPTGTTAQRPGSPAIGMVRFNSTLNAYEMHGGARWEVMPSGQARRAASNPSTVTSTTNTTFRDMWTFTYSPQSSEPKILSFGFTAWNNSGAYYWGWRLYNNTKSAVIPILNVSCLPENYISSGGGIGFQGAVHNASAQPYVVFDMSASDSGDTIAVQMSNTISGNASNPIASTQQLNAKSFKAFYGTVTGYSGTDYVGT